MNRTLLLGTAWTASAGAAVGLGFLAVSLVDASASPRMQPVASSATESGDSAAATTIAPPAPTAQQVTPGGTVVASCADGSSVPVLSGAPAAGWWPDDSQQPGKWEFHSATQSIEVRATCVDGTPRFVVEGPRADDDHGGDVVTTAPAAPSHDDHGGDVVTTAPAAPSHDDHGGDVVTTAPAAPSNAGARDDHGGSNSGSSSGSDD